MSYRSKTSPVQLYGQDGTDSCSVGAQADQNLRHRSLHDLPVNSTFTQLWLFLAIRFLSSTVFASSLHYLPGIVMDLQ